MAVKKPDNYYEHKHNSKFPNKKIVVIHRINNYIYFKTKYGLCKKSIFDFNKSFDIRSAIDKTDFLKNKLIEKYGNKYDFSLVKYTDKKHEKIKLICKYHGIFETTKGNAISGKSGCMKCMSENIGKINSSNTDEFIQKANIKHNCNYIYKKTIYNGRHSKLIVTCKIHGDFEQEAGGHLAGQGCPKCGKINTRKYNIKHPTGWTLINWIKSSKKSKRFDSFKVYIIKCWNDGEEFYKIGRTYLKTKYRFSGKILPYKYKIIKEIIGTAEYVYNLENKLKKMNKENKYIPKIEFGGMHECFNKINNI